MEFMFIEDYPHNSDSEEGFLSYEFARKFNEHTIHCFATDYKKIRSNYELDNFILSFNFNLISLKKIDCIFIDQGSIGSINLPIERKIDSSGIPVITFSEINKMDESVSKYIFHITHIMDCNIDILYKEFYKWQNQQIQVNQ